MSLVWVVDSLLLKCEVKQITDMQMMQSNNS